MTDLVIAARGLTKRFGKVVAVDDLDLNVPGGAAFGLLGPAGAGKSTVVRLLAGLARPTAGTLTIGGDAPGSIAARRRLGVLLQDAQLYHWMTGREALAFAADMGGVKGPAVSPRIDDIAGRLSLGAVLGRRVGAIDAQTRGLLAIGVALVGEPEVLLLDEPFQWLDADARRDVLAVLGGLHGATTIVLAAHRPADVEALCDHVAVLESGKLVVAAPARQLGWAQPSAYVVEIRAGGGLALAGLVARLRAEPWVASVEATEERLRVVVADEERAARELLPAVVATGLQVAGFRSEARAIGGDGVRQPGP